jgi:6-phosphogluconolactonase (cycloisomerase 2 family)
MTDRAQPGAIDSLLRNDELAQSLDAFSTGGIISGSNPTDASIRRSDIDETALDAFSLSSSAASFDVTVAPGEAFLAGWLCRDTSTTLTLPANSTTDIVIGHATDAIFDPAVDPDRDAADEVIVDLAGNVAGDIPQVVAHRVETDGSGVTSASRIATVGGFSEVETGDLAVSGSVTEPLTVGKININGEATGIDTLIDVQTEADLPPVDPPQIAFIQNKNEYQRSVNKIPINVSNASFEQQISSQDSNPNGLTFNNDGSRLYEIGQGSQLIYESSLSKNFDISTATLQQSISTQDKFAQGLAFNDDGSRLYEIGPDQKKIFESSLSTNFDISTATLQQSIATQDSAPFSLTFNNDGSRLYETGDSGQLIYQSSLSTDFDISTATLQQSIATQDTSTQGIIFDSNGSRLFEIGRDSDLIYESSLSTNFDISSASFIKSVPSRGTQPKGIAIDKDETRLYEIGSDNDQIVQFNGGAQAGFKTF